jgi:hypothetical protein
MTHEGRAAQSDGHEHAPRTRPGVDVTRPNAARVYDYLIGGDYAYGVDKEYAERGLAEVPFMRDLALANRHWLGRVVRSALDAGITQFLDLGSGLPSPGAVHEFVAQHPATRGAEGRVVYVDYEPIAAAHWQIRIADTPEDAWIAALQADVREPQTIFADSKVGELLDFSQPICALVVSVLHFVNDETDVPGLLTDYRSRLAPGSWLAVSHLTHDNLDPDVAATLVKKYAKMSGPVCPRDYTAVASWLEAWGDVLAPGVVHIPDWRPGLGDSSPVAKPDMDAARPMGWCGVSVKPSQPDA